MWFEPHHYSDYNYTDEVSVSFAFSFIEFNNNAEREIAFPKSQVKKCGIHVLESKDLKKYNLTPSEAKEKARNKSAATIDEPKSTGPTETDEFTTLDEPGSSSPTETEQFTILNEPKSSSPTETD
ncbi:uncharacterized protein LOC112090458 [Morus notabilis]|uniref:uncharacterized protein LOC112090458 n=1 Tax=Morus notabilis TaxID=981085 RepID=UPI000CED6DEC|nr:uncharacterized protein LOC112090458 [Morus notabilis]